MCMDNSLQCKKRNIFINVIQNLIIQIVKKKFLNWNFLCRICIMRRMLWKLLFIKSWYLHNHNETIEKDKFITEDGEKTYISCDEVIENYIKCDRRDNYNQYKDAFYFNGETKKCALKIIYFTNYDFCE